MSYRPQLKTSGGMIDFPLDAETIKGKTLLEQTYPVGSIYLSVDSTSPASLFGGTWERIKDRFLLGAGDTYTAGNTGGSATHYHNLDDSGYAKIFGYSSLGTLVYKEVNTNGQYWTNNQKAQCSSVGSDTSKTDQYGTALGGGTASASSLPPYLVVYMWKRTA